MCGHTGRPVYEPENKMHDPLWRAKLVVWSFFLLTVATFLMLMVT